MPREINRWLPKKWASGNLVAAKGIKKRSVVPDSSQGKIGFPSPISPKVTVFPVLVKEEPKADKHAKVAEMSLLSPTWEILLPYESAPVTR